MKLLIWGLVLLAIFALGLWANIGDGVFMFLWVGLIVVVLGAMKVARPAG
ncbi:hypothetical protein GCM10027449_02310 [Sinomonas notoginsengisoli]|nr:hypothetical protein [Sinomonas notoginsengisoli]